MNDETARTIKAAEAQVFELPEYDYWVQFAHLIDGYAICEELGVRDTLWFEEHYEQFQTDPKSLTVLDARLMLFFEARQMRFSSGPDNFTLINGLLQLIAEKTEKPYQALTEEDITNRLRRFNDVMKNQIIDTGDDNGKE